MALLSCKLPGVAENLREGVDISISSAFTGKKLVGASRLRVAFSQNNKSLRWRRRLICQAVMESKAPSKLQAQQMSAGQDRLLKVPVSNIRNFSIIAHIDHGKSTLADKLLQLTGTVETREMKEQFLDNMDLERERGITIKLQAARMRYLGQNGEPYCLNLIDTPGHVDFSYEVSRSLAACEGALLVVDASQGVEAQTLANVYMALENNLEIIPVINKIDLPGAEPQRVSQEIEEIVGLDCSEAIFCSAKEGIGIHEILEAIVKKIPPPKNTVEKPLRALIFDSYYDAYRGVIVYFRVIDGTIKKGEKVLFMASEKEYYVDEIGVLSPSQMQVDELYAGEVGYMAASIRSVIDARVGDTITNSVNRAETALPGYEEATPMVFSGLFPVDADQFTELRDALEKLQLNDAALNFEPESSSAMGLGFRCGFLGLLHMEIVQERLEREYNLNLITTAPSVVYRVHCTNGKMIPRMEDILNLPVQDPPCAEFSAAHLNWVKVEGGRQGGDDIALIPFSRVGDFVRGESTNTDCPASFRIESRRKRAEGSLSRPRVDGYLEYTIYWCSYGPEDYRDSEPGSGDGSNNKPTSGKGSRPGRRHMMRGCLCHFTVKRLYTRPSIALMIYNQRNHVDKTGSPCHGSLDRDAIGTRAMYAPRISDELRQRIMSMLYIGISMDNIMQNHNEEVEKHGGPSNRDDLLTRNDVRNMERVIRQSTYELDTNDLLSIRTWVQRHQKYVFFYQDLSVSEPFILGIQTEWQLQQMIRFGHNSYIAADSTFGTNKLRNPLYTLLVFDVHQNALPVAWIITPSLASHSIQKWMGALCERLRTKDPKWKPYAFMIDDAASDFSMVRDVFQCRILLCLWRIRRAWLRNIIKRCCNIDVQREMFKRLGSILYTTRNGPTAMDAVEEFMQVFVDQNAFLEYFKIRWLPKIEIWVAAMRTLPLANQEMHGAIEAYHARLKPKLLNDLQSGACQRVDWLVHALTTEVHSYYWFEQYADESGSFRTIRDELNVPTSYQRAIQIPDGDVLLDEDDLRYVKVVCQSDRTRAYIVWNPGSEFAFCDCSWSRLGNLCKHVIKVNIICRNHHLARPSLALQTYRQIMLSLLQNPPDDPIVLDHAIVHATRMQHDLKGLTDLSNQGLLQPVLQLETHSHGLENPRPQAVPSVDRIAKRPKTSSPRTNANNAFIDLTGQNSVATNVHSMVSSHMRDVVLFLEAQPMETRRTMQDDLNAAANIDDRHEMIQ